MKTEILKMLRSRTGYISGQELCDTLGVSRTAVWKVINQLKEEGYQIEAVRNKGYHLLEAPDILNAEEIESLIVNHNVDTFLFGSRSEFDSLCHSLVTELKEKYPHIKRI
ncbi:MAG: biotin operon repressor, partial [Lachnospiraceae bacterium]